MRSGIMKAVITLLFLLLIVLGVLLWLATPHEWLISQGTLKAKKVTVDGQSYVMIEGEAMNQLGQIQSVNLKLDDDRNKLLVSRCMVRWNPLSKITVNNQWPVFYPLESAKPGKYSVVYMTKEGEVTAGSFEVNK